MSSAAAPSRWSRCRCVTSTASAAPRLSPAGSGSSTSGFATWFGVPGTGGSEPAGGEHRVDEERGAAEVEQQRRVTEEPEGRHAASIPRIASRPMRAGTVSHVAYTAVKGTAMTWPRSVEVGPHGILADREFHLLDRERGQVSADPRTLRIRSGHHPATGVLTMHVPAPTRCPAASSPARSSRATSPGMGTARSRASGSAARGASLCSASSSVTSSSRARPPHYAGSTSGR